MYILHGSLASPYSVKLRALMRYRRIGHVWAQGGSAHRLAHDRLKAPVIPVLEYPDGSVVNDTTPLIYDLEARHPERSVIPPDPATAFIAHLIEDFADEWLTKAMFGYRWLEEVDQVQMSHWLAFDGMSGGGLDQINAWADGFAQRQIGRMALVGCTRENFPLIEASTRRVLSALEQHVVDRFWFFGTRPSLAEFGVFGQLSQLGVDPTAQTMMRADYPYTYRWLMNVDDASGVDGEWDAVGSGLMPVVTAMLAEVGRVYVPFLLANAVAATGGTFRIEVDGMPYEQGAFGYQRKCLADLRARYADLSDAARAALDPVLGEAGCLDFLKA